MKGLDRMLGRGMSWLGLALVLQRAASFLITAILARLLRPADFGVVAMATMVTGFLAMFGELGITTALVQRTDVEERHLSTSFWISTAAGALLGLATVALAGLVARAWHEPRLLPVMGIMALSLPLSASSHVPHSLLQRRLAFGRIAVIETLASVLAGSAGVAAALLGGGVWALVVQALLFQAVLAVGRFAAAGWWPHRLFDGRAALELSAFGVGVLGCGVVNFGARYVDNAIVGGVLGARALGYYSLAYNLVILPGMSIGAVVTRVAYPALTRVRNDEEEFRRIYLDALGRMAAVAVPAVVGLALLAPEVVRLLYGPGWAEVADLLRRLSPIGIGEALSVAGLVFYAHGRPNLLLAWAGLSVALMATAFAIGVRGGLHGVTWAYLAVVPVLYGAPHVVAARMCGLRPGRFARAALPPLLASLIMAAAVLAVGPGNASPLALAARVAAGATTYALALAALGGWPFHAWPFRRRGLLPDAGI